MKNKLLKPNETIGLKTGNSLSATQRKIYNVFLKTAQEKVKFNDFGEIEEEEFYFFNIDCKKAHRKAGAKNKNLKYIEKELDSLMGMIATVREEDNPDDWKEKFSILPTIKKENGKYRFALFGTLVKALKEQNYFTILDLVMLKNLDSQYSIIFYELAIRYEKYKIPKMSVEKIREITNTQNKYLDIRDLKKRVLDRACNEISAKTNIKLSYTTEKIGRRIAYIDFKIKKKDNQPKIENKQEEKLKDSSKSAQNGSGGFSDDVEYLSTLLPSELNTRQNKKVLEGFLKRHEVKYIKGDIEYAKKQDNISSFIGWLKSSCKRCLDNGGCGSGGHYSAQVIANQELKKKKKEQEEKEKQYQEKIKKKARKKAEKEAPKVYQNLSEEEIAEYEEKYQKSVRNIPDRFSYLPSKKEFILGSIEDKLFQKEIEKSDIDIF